MSLWKKECLQRSIDRAVNRKESGQTGWAAGLFLALFLGIFLCAVLQLERYRATALYLEDALAASNLASAVIDVAEYGISHTILLSDPREAYERYLLAVRGNLNLNDEWEGSAGSLVQGPVSVVNYIVYNVRDDMVTVYCFDADGVLSQWQEDLDNAKAPNNVSIVSTSVYSELRFEVIGFPGISVKAHKGVLADITR